MSVTYDVFISYRWTEPDQSWVREQLVPALKAAGLRVCLDVLDFVPGKDLIVEMNRLGIKSRKVLCILSPDYFKGNRMVHFESLEARRTDPGGARSRVIPLILRKTRVPRWMAGLIPIDWTDAPNREREWSKLLNVLGAATTIPPPALDKLSKDSHLASRRRQEKRSFSVGCYNYPPFSLWKSETSACFKPGALASQGATYFGGPWFTLMERLATQLKLNLSYGTMSSVGLTDLANWNYDFIPGVFRTRERERCFDFSIPLHRIGLQGVCRAGRRFSKIQLIKGDFRIVVQPGEVGWEYVKAEFPTAFARGNILQVSSEQTRDVLNMLVSGEYDLAIGDEISCLHFVRNRRWRGQFVLAFPERLQIFDAGVAVKKALRFDMRRLNEALRQVRSASEFLQMEGRALRGFEGIERCSIDHV